MTLDQLIESRRQMSWEDEVRAWADDKRKAEERYLASIRLADAQIFEAYKRIDKKEPKS